MVSRLPFTPTVLASAPGASQGGAGPTRRAYGVVTTAPEAGALSFGSTPVSHAVTTYR